VCQTFGALIPGHRNFDFDTEGVRWHWHSPKDRVQPATFLDGCGSCEVSWLRCEDEAVAVFRVVDAFVLAAEVEAPLGVEVAAGDDGAELQDGLGAFEPPSRARYVHSVLTMCLHAPSMTPVAMGQPFLSAVA